MGRYYQVFIYQIYGFDAVNKNALWKTLNKPGCPVTFFSVLKGFQERMESCFNISGKLSGSILFENGVKQVDITVPILFALYFSMDSWWLLKDTHTGLYVKSEHKIKTTCQILKIRRLAAKTNLSSLISNLLYTDNFCCWFADGLVTSYDILIENIQSLGSNDYCCHIWSIFRDSWWIQRRICTFIGSDMASRF